VKELVRRYQSAPPKEKDAVRTELLQLTTQQFDQRHQQRLKDLKVLEEKLKSLQTELQKRQELKNEIIQKRVADLLSDENLLKWEEEPSPAKSAVKP
jgi:hypothetical protein